MDSAGSATLHGRVAVVTGAGGRCSIGTAICRALAGRGADVFFSHWKVHGEQVEALLGELRAAGVRADAAEVDLSLPDAPEGLLEAAEDRLGSPSILINNAA